MHNLNRVLVATAILAVFCVLGAFANGQGEHANVTGTVSSIQPVSGSNTVTITLSTKTGSYSVTVDKSVVNAASLQVGKTISLSGAVHSTVDGAKEINASQVKVDGQEYQVPEKPATVGVGSGASKDKADSPDSTSQHSSDGNHSDSGSSHSVDSHGSSHDD